MKQHSKKVKRVNLITTIICIIALICGIGILFMPSNPKPVITSYEQTLTATQKDEIIGKVLKVEIDDPSMHEATPGWSMKDDTDNRILLIPKGVNKLFNKGDVMYFRVTNIESINNGDQYNLYGDILKSEVSK